jgi:hypothetical protein
LLLQIAIGQFGSGVGEGDFLGAALVDIAVEQPGHGIVGVAAHAALPFDKRVTTPPPQTFKNYSS